MEIVLRPGNAATLSACKLAAMKVRTTAVAVQRGLFVEPPVRIEERVTKTSPTFRTLVARERPDHDT